MSRLIIIIVVFKYAQLTSHIFHIGYNLLLYQIEAHRQQWNAKQQIQWTAGNAKLLIGHTNGGIEIVDGNAGLFECGLIEALRWNEVAKALKEIKEENGKLCNFLDDIHVLASIKFMEIHENS